MKKLLMFFSGIALIFAVLSSCAREDTPAAPDPEKTAAVMLTAAAQTETAEALLQVMTQTPTATPSAWNTATVTPSMTATFTPTCTATKITIMNDGGVYYWSDGTYALSAKQYLYPPDNRYDSCGQANNGIYRIGLNSGGYTDLYCDMTADGGGWMLVCNFKHPANYENFFYSHNDSAFGPDIGNPSSSAAWSDWRPLSNITWPAQVVVAVDWTTAASLPSHNKKAIFRVKRRDVMPHYNVISDLVSEDNLYYRIYFTDAWSDVGSMNTTTAISWGARNSSGSFLISLYEGGDRTTFCGSGIPGGDDSWGHDSHWFIREE